MVFLTNSRLVPFSKDMVKSYVRSAVATNSTYQNTKWVLSQMLAGGSSSGKSWKW